MTGDEEDPGEKGPGGYGDDQITGWSTTGTLKAMSAKNGGKWALLPCSSALQGNLARSWGCFTDWQRFPQPLACPTLMMQHLALTTRSSQADEFPRSLMGALSLMRQTLLNAQYSTQQTGKLEYDPSLEALLPVLSGQTRLLIEPGSVLMASRTHQIANAFGIRPILVASGQEWRRPGRSVRN